MLIVAKAGSPCPAGAESVSRPSSPSTALIAPVALAVVVAFFAPAALATTAMLPLDAPGLLPQARSDLDAGLRDALRTTDALALQPLDRTTRLIAEAVGAGLDCSLTEEPCALRAGLAAEVDSVIMARVDRVADRLVLQLALLDEGGAPPRRVVAVIEPPDHDSGASVRAAAARLLRGIGAPTVVPVLIEVDPADAVVVVDGSVTGAGVVWLMPGPHQLHVERVDHQPERRDVDVSADVRAAPLRFALKPIASSSSSSSSSSPPPSTSSAPPPVFLAGVGVASAGALVAVGGAVVAVVVEGLLVEKMSFEDREGLRLIGVASLVAIPVGVVAAGLGSAVGVFGASE